MPTHADIVRLNLEFYRKQAKSLLKAAKSGDHAAFERLKRHSPNLSGAAESVPALHDAQLTVAREQGFLSWPRFQTFITRSRLDYQNLASAFVDAALSDLRRAGEMLTDHPDLAGAGYYSALVLGDSQSVRKVLKANPEATKTKGGAKNWEPLLYVCFSRFAGRKSGRADQLIETARLLLDHGADPSTSYNPEEWPDNPLSCLYAATGLNNNPALAAVLLEAGANPNDSESLYHSTEHADLECMRLLLANGALPKNTNALKHMLDREDLEGLRLLLAAGADPNEVNHRGETALHWAVYRGRSVQTIAGLLDGGAAIDMRRYDGRTAYSMAALRGQSDVAALLAARGADTSLSPLDRFVGACAAARPEELNRLLAEQPDIPKSPEAVRLIPDLAASHSTSAVRGLLAAGLPVDARGEMGATALHWACWKGYADLVDLLLEHHASLTIEDQEHHGTPPGWFGHGVQNCGEGCGDYPQVARLLIAAGAAIPARDIPTGNADVDAVLREAGLIQPEKS